MLKTRNNPAFPSRRIPGKTPLRPSEIMEEAWASGTFWYSLPLSRPTGLFSLFYEHIQPLLSKNDAEEIGEIMTVYW